MRKLININELSEMIGVGVGSIYNLVSMRRIPFVKIGRLTRFDLDMINEWIAENTVAPRKAVDRN